MIRNLIASLSLLALMIPSIASGDGIRKETPRAMSALDNELSSVRKNIATTKKTLEDTQKEIDDIRSGRKDREKAYRGDCEKACSVCQVPTVSEEAPLCVKVFHTFDDLSSVSPACRQAVNQCGQVAKIKRVNVLRRTEADQRARLARLEADQTEILNSIAALDRALHSAQLAGTSPGNGNQPQSSTCVGQCNRVPATPATPSVTAQQGSPANGAL